MSKQAEHTPGPWHFFDGGGEYFPKVQLGGEKPRGFTKWSIGINSCRGLNGGDIGELIANAHLISAAPDLLAACEQAIRILDGADSDEGLRAILESAKAAVTKARGTTP